MVRQTQKDILTIIERLRRNEEAANNCPNQYQYLEEPKP